MFWDNHMHSDFSGDSTANPLDMINAAKAKNLGGITFTDHLDLDYKEEPGLFDLNISDYYSKQRAIASEYSTASFTILTGIEVGLQPQVADRNRELVLSEDFDYIIGSTHVIDGDDPYFNKIWNEHTPDYIFQRYYECILENIKCFNDFDAIGHLDYAFRYYNNPEKAYDSYLDFSEVVDAILDEIIRKDKALEINSAAFRKGFSQPNPCDKIIKRYREKGGSLITLGADAHFPEHVACDFDRMTALISDCGFKEFVVYKKRIPISYPL